MELHDAIYHRRSVRRYLEREVDASLIHQVIDAAIQAPSGLNQQPWAFAVIHGRRRLHDYSVRAKRHLLANYPTAFEPHPRVQLYQDPDYDMFYGADTAIVIYASPGRLHAAEDCCLAAENLMLAAHGLGLGTCPIGFARPWFDQPETKRALGVPEHYQAIFPLIIGHPAGEPDPVPRRSPEIVCWQWDAAPAPAAAQA
jgi:nitroreductase